MSQLNGYELHGYGMRTYCKITEYGIDTPEYKCTISFGSGIKKFCMVAAYTAKNPYEIYIDRIEKKDICTIDYPLAKYDEGTANYVRICLYTLSILYPHVQRYTFQDSSQLYCNGEDSTVTMSMSYDYILKYNKTWYEKKFGAVLPGYNENKCDPDSLMDQYMKSLTVLDEKRDEYSFISERFPIIEQYKIDYELATTPRDFMMKLRTKLGKEYCSTVGKWLNGYMLLLRIKAFFESWYIKKEQITMPSGFHARKLDISNVLQKLNGGSRKTRKQMRYGIIHKPIQYGYGVETDR